MRGLGVGSWPRGGGLARLTPLGLGRLLGATLSWEGIPTWLAPGLPFPPHLILSAPAFRELQIEGPRGEKGQKGEPAIVEPVRALSSL